MERYFTNKFVGTGPSSYEKIIYRAAVSQRLRNTVIDRGEACPSFRLSFFHAYIKLLNDRTFKC